MVRRRADSPSARAAPQSGSPKSCPSGPCEEGALLVGVMTSAGRLAYLLPPTEIDAEFVAEARRQGNPERRFRFSTPCVEASCPQWDGTGCGLGAAIAEHGSETPTDGLPNCAIRKTCRWYAEQGGRACAVCPLIVADTGGTGTYTSLMSAANSTSEPDGRGDGSDP